MATLLPVLGVLLLLCVSFCSCHMDCMSQSSCSQCLMLPACVWCSSPTSAHCLSRNSAHTCSNGSDLVDPQTTVTINTRPLDKDNQVSVTSVQMKLRVGVPQSFTVSAKAADNFPLDFYMLMDLSASFYSSLEFVENFAPQIVGTIANLTSRFQVGFGAFVDKPTPPFSSPLALKLSYTLSDGQQSACSSLHCSRPVSYEHVVNLTNSTEHFSQLLQNITISTSSDDAEGTLDAMMQAVVCTDTVGWRAEARKVLFVMTDDLIHTAGDGRLAGIYRPNDGMCHTKFDSTENKVLYAYSAALTYDYPTLEQMRMVLEEYGVVPVFAVSGTMNTYDYFSMLATPDKLGGYISKYIRTDDSNNLLNVIKEAYQNVTSHVMIKHSHHNSISILVVAFCPNSSATNEDKSQCYNVSGQTVDFNVTINLTSCTETLKAYPFREYMRIPGFGQFLLTMEGICTCDCETETDLLSETCSKNGNLTCGQCNCFEGWAGDDCSCSSTASCPRGSNDKVCSGRGSCVCGQCVCHQPNTTHSGVPMPLVFGTSCECDNFLCDKGLNGLVCSGQGTCECSNSEYTCSCYYSNITGHRYEGTACQCSYDNCVDPMDPCHSMDNVTCPLCNSHGNCIRMQCGSPYPSCHCHNGYHGIYCQDELRLQSCTDSSIQCVVCFGRAASQGENLTTACGSHQCAGYSILTGPQQHGYQIAGSNTTHSCSYTDMNGCYFGYYATQIDGRRLYEVEPEVCVFPRWAISVVIFTFTVISGVCCIVLVKLLIMATDYKESNSLSTDCVYKNIKLNLVEPLEEQFATSHSHNATQFSMEENTAYGCAQAGLYDKPHIIQIGASIQKVVEEQFATSHSHNTTQFSMEENTAYGCAQEGLYDEPHIIQVGASVQEVVEEQSATSHSHNTTQFIMEENTAYGCAQEGLYDEPHIIQVGASIQEVVEELSATSHSHNTTQFIMEENTAYGCAREGQYNEPCIIQEDDSIQEVMEEQFATLHSNNATQFIMEENTAYGCARQGQYDEPQIQDGGDSTQEVIVTESGYYKEINKSNPLPVTSANSDDSDEYQ